MGHHRGHRRGRRAVTALTLVIAVTGGVLAGTPTAATAGGHGAARPETAGDAIGERRPATRKPVAFTRQVTMNVAHDMRPWRHRQDIRRATHRADVIGWQQINRRSQTRPVRNLKGWGTYWPGGKRRDGRVRRHPANANPISWRQAQWAFVHGGSRLASREIPRVCRDRYLTFVVLRHRDSGEKIVRWNMHFVPNALNRKKVRAKAARRAAWQQEAATVKKLLEDVSNRGMAAVIGGGDINSRNVDFAGDRISYDTDHRGVDYLTHVPSYRVRAWEPRFYEMHSDHDKVRVAYTVYR